MNATRLFSTLYGQTLNVGRVMTPTLAMIVQREAEIESFKSEPIYRLSISCGGITAVSDRFEKKEDRDFQQRMSCAIFLKMQIHSQHLCVLFHQMNTKRNMRSLLLRLFLCQRMNYAFR